MKDEVSFDEISPGPYVLQFVNQAVPNDVVASMSDADLFSALPKTQCKEVLSWSRSKVFRRHELLFEQGAPVERMVLIQSGRVKITQSSSDGNEVILWILGPGDAVDARIEAPGCFHTCSATAMEHCKALVWEHRRFAALGTRFPQIRTNLCSILTNRLQELELRFSELATDKASQRLGMALLRLAGCVRTDTRGEVKLNLTREELGQLTGLTVFTISRLFSTWAASGMILPGRESVVIRDIAQLQALVSPAQKEPKGN